MNKELAKSKKPADDGKKFLKRSDVEAEREAKAAAKRKREEDAAAESAAREEKRRRLAEESRRRREEQEAEEERARRKRLGLPELVKATSEDVEEGVGGAPGDIPDEELLDKLREIGHPARLFAETHAARLRRYRKLTTVVTNGPIPTTLQLVEAKDMKVDGSVPQDKEGRKWLFRQLASYFTMVLTEYQRAMEEEKQETTASKTAYSAMVQTRENMKPVRLHSHPPQSRSHRTVQRKKLTSPIAVPKVRGRRPRRLAHRAHRRDRQGPPGAPLCRRQQRLLAPEHRQGGVAHRRDHGGHPRAQRAREAPRRRKGPCHGRRGHAQVPAEHQALPHLFAGPLAARGPETADGLMRVAVSVSWGRCRTIGAVPDCLPAPSFGSLRPPAPCSRRGRELPLDVAMGSQKEAQQRR